MMALGDAKDGDADAEDNGDLELTGDEKDVGWNEWHGRGRWKGVGHEMAQTIDGSDDTEDDDADTCAAAEDQGAKGNRWFDCDGLPGDAADAEDSYDQEEDRGGY